MSIKKLTDWKNYWYGLRTNLFKCIGTTGTMWLGSNGLASTGIPGTGDVALNWHQAVGMFAVHIGLEIFTYMKNKQPDIIEQEVDTATFTKSPLLIGSLLLSLSVGCVSAEKLAKELSRDNATVSVSVTTIYGTVRVWRANPMESHAVTFGPDGTPIITKSK